MHNSSSSSSSSLSSSFWLFPSDLTSMELAFASVWLLWGWLVVEMTSSDRSCPLQASKSGLTLAWEPVKLDEASAWGSPTLLIPRAWACLGRPCGLGLMIADTGTWCWDWPVRGLLSHLWMIQGQFWLARKAVAEQLVESPVRDLLPSCRKVLVNSCRSRAGFRSIQV